jgi:two-component system, response regulator PdtaR
MTAHWPLAMTSEPGNGDSDPRSSREPAARRDAGRRVAIVEDELMVAWSLESMVEDLGYEVTGIFARGEAALAEIDPEGTDIVLMDINLGAGLDGVETARLLLQNERYRILFVSAYADPATQARIEEAVPGAQLLRKPISFALLAEALVEGIGSRH